MWKNAALCLLYFTFYLPLSGNAQDYPLTDTLKLNYENAKSAEDKIFWLSKLAGFYMNLNNQLSDDYGNKMLEIAELSRDRSLIVRALLHNADRQFNSNGSQEGLNKARTYAERAFAIAKANNNEADMAWSHILLARAARNGGSYDKALNHNNLALSLASSQDDSLKIAAHISLGNTYMVREEKLLAFRNYLQALNLADELKQYESLRSAYYTMADFYLDLNDHEKAKDFLFKIQRITYEYNKPYDRLNLYNAIGRIYTAQKQFDMANKFYEKSMMLADTLKLEVVKLNAHFNIINQYLANNQGEKMLEFMKTKPELKHFLEKGNLEHYLHHVYAMAYMDMRRYDSADYYFKKAEAGFLAKTNRSSQYELFTDYATYYTKVGNAKKALEYWMKAKQISDERRDLGMQKEVVQHLDTVYQMLGDYRNAYHYNTLYHTYRDSLEKLSTEKDLLLLEVENENRRKEREALVEQEALREWHNIQYMGITAAIIAVFIFLVMLGLFTVSKTTVRILGFFAFIFLFEFIILIADNKIHHWTHGEPWKILAIKIVLISILLPFHHYLEKRVINYLTSRKMIELDRKTLLSKLTGKTEADHVVKS